jgi:hypothetical protein
VLIPDGIEPAAAARSLAKIADFVERDLADMRRLRDKDNSGTGPDTPF